MTAERDPDVCGCETGEPCSIVAALIAIPIEPAPFHCVVCGCPVVAAGMCGACFDNGGVCPPTAFRGSSL